MQSRRRNDYEYIILKGSPKYLKGRFEVSKGKYLFTLKITKIYVQNSFVFCLSIFSLCVYYKINFKRSIKKVYLVA